MNPNDVIEARWQRATTIIARRVAGETVLVPLAKRTTDPEFKSARLYVLNETGEYLWSLLDSPRTSGDLARNLSLVFETTAGRAHSDVDVFLAALRDIGAVCEVSDPEAE